MGDRIRFLLNRLHERLWFKPLFICLLSIAAVFLAKLADNFEFGDWLPDISPDSVDDLLKIIATSMMVIATFAVASMVSAYASASATATPRSFPLILADDVSQNALSSFIGAFIYSIVALIAITNGYYDKAGRFALLALTVTVITIVIGTFVRWVDRIARLGRLGEAIDKIEAATDSALTRRRHSPTLRGVPVGQRRMHARTVYAPVVGYIQRIDIPALQKYAKKARLRITLAALPGTFAAPGRALAYVTADSGDNTEIDSEWITREFRIGDGRLFDEDPRFGFVVLSEIASRALSPAVNDPGTAIDIIGTLVRLFTRWAEPVEPGDRQTPDCDRIEVPELSLQDMFDDAFSAISRDGAGTVEVAVRLQKAFESLGAAGDARLRDVACHHARLALARSEKALDFGPERELVRRTARFAVQADA